MKAHLLHENADFDFEWGYPPNREDLIQDLGLATVLEAMADGDSFLFEIAERVLLASLADPAAIVYRQRVLADCVAQPRVVREMYAIAVGALRDKRGLWGYSYSSQRPSSILSAAVSQLEVLVVRLRELRQVADLHAGKFQPDGLAAFFRTLKRELDDDYFEALSRHLRELRFRGGELVSAGLGRDNSGISYVLRSPPKVRRGWKERVGIGPRSSYSFTIPPRDEAGAQALSDITSRGINLVANAAAQSADHVSSYFTMLRAELGFYVGCLNLRDRLMAKGEPVTFPAPSAASSRGFSCSDLRDAGLALRIEDRAVGNDADAGGKPLVIITGANSGGKSTFLRSVGLAQLMMQCGMFVTAGSFRASVCERVFTHFIREEDRTMSSGRLDEELGRMSRIADQVRPHCLVLFNESFAATNEREGSEIGRQVVRALLEADVRVFFVTHQFDFAESFRLRHASSTLFLRAGRQADGRRNFKLAAADPLPTSYGEDIYDRIGGWMGEH
ncbi:MAG: DNA mismatch repair protein MutS [Actinomycetota bacterium]|nr:DNA mismatch repair protein MutS [Actinomycetota bacterium]